MRGDADAGLGAIVDEDFAGEEFLANFGSVRAVDGDGAGALGGIFGGIHAPAARFGGIEQSRRHTHGFFADSGYANLIEDLEAGTASIERGDVRRAIEKAERVFPAMDGAGFESEGTLMR